MTKDSIGSGRAKAVLEPSFVADLAGLGTDEVRRRRDESFAEREFLSYLRRLLQVRLDILGAEQARRRSGDEPGPVVERLTAVLSQGGRAGGGSRGEALRTRLSAADVEQAERQADVLASGVSMDDPVDLTDEALATAEAALAEAERAVSSQRATVMRVHDALQDELKRRYRENPAEIPSGV